MSVPTGTHKKIDDMGVFITTAIFSIFAYMWMFIVLKVWSADYVEIAEAVLTLVFFVILVVLAFAADKYNEIKKKKLAEKNNEMPEREGVTREEFYRIVGIKNEDGRKKKENESIPIKPKKEESAMDSSNITSSKKDIEGEDLLRGGLQEEEPKHQTSVRETTSKGESKKVRRTTNGRRRTRGLCGSWRGCRTPTPKRSTLMRLPRN